MVPEELLQAHEEDDKVVFFCGAGVSMPAGLPSFKGLVKDVLKDLLPSEDYCQPGTAEAMAWRAFCEGRHDEALEILENPREGVCNPKPVREKVSALLMKRPQTLEKHLTLARLADLDQESGRLVTTNFDHLFEKAVRKLRRQKGSKHRPTIHTAPALPPAKRPAFRGLAYLHGKLGSSPDDQHLVLTTADFGRAYMVEGWARRFVVDLFRHYHVVFIGYSVEDPMMRYLVSALAAVREESEENEETLQQFRQPYAFAKKGADETGGEQQWKLKGIEPILYDDAGKPDKHSELWRILKEWGDDHRQDLARRRYKVARLGQLPPKDEKDPVVRDMAWALKDAKGAKYFASLEDERRPHPGWIAHLQREGLLGLPIGKTDKQKPIAAPLVSQQLTGHFPMYAGGFHETAGVAKPSQWLTAHLPLHVVTHELSRWIVECLDTQGALDWALRGGGVLHADLRRQIRFQLDDKETKLRPAFRKIWQVLADDGYAHALSEKSQGTRSLSIPRLAPDAVFAKQVFLKRLRPLPVFKADQGFKAIFGDLRNEPKDPKRPSDRYRTEIELLGIQHRSEDVKRFRERAENWEKFLASIADELTALLLEAMDWFREFDKAATDWDITYYEYPSISPHEQNRYASAWTQLIALTRESYDALVAAGNQDAAGRLARKWRSLRYPVFRRLALYAATETGMHEVKLGLEVLLEGPQPALWGIHTQRETLRFLRKRAKDIPKERLDRLIEEILEGPPSLYRQDTPEDTWKGLRDRAIRLRLDKLTESGAALPDTYREACNRIPTLQSNSYPWPTLGDHPEEFVSPQYAVIAGDPFESSKDDPSVDFAHISVEQFVKWAKTQTGGYWECSRDWRWFAENDIDSAVKLLKSAADKRSWPIPPWYKVLEMLREKEEKQDGEGTINDDLKRKVAGALITMPLETLAKLDVPASRWLREVRANLDEKSRCALWRSVWDASLTDDKPEGNLDFQKACNHAGGILGEILWKELADCIPKFVAGKNPGFPEQLRSNFELVAEENRPSGNLARVNISPWIAWFYRIDRDWTERTFFQRMDPDDEKTFDPYLWEGYFWYPQCTADLLTAFKPQFFKILGNLDRLRESVRDTVCSNGAALFIDLAVPTDRGIDTEEAKGVLWSIGIDGLTDAARRLRDMLDGAGEKSGVLWRDTVDPWFAKAWPRRLKDRSPDLSEQLAWMAMESGDAFPQAVAAIEDILAPEKHNTTFSILMEKKDIIERYPDAVLTLAARLVDDSSDGWDLSDVLKRIAKAKPEMKEDDRFRKLVEKADLSAY